MLTKSITRLHNVLKGLLMRPFLFGVHKQMSNGPSMQITLACERLKDKVLSSLSEATNVHIGIIDDAEIATYAAYQEYGWVQRVTQKQSNWFSRQGIRNPPKAGASLVSPPRPFLRGTLKAENKKWLRVYENAIKAYGVLDASKALNAVGMIASDDVRQTLINGGTSLEQFEGRADLTMALYGLQASGKQTDGTGNIQGEKPLVKTGALLNSIGYQLS